MAAALLPTGGIALVGALDSDTGTRDAKTALQAMQVDLTQEMVDELLASVRSGKVPQILFGQTPVCAAPLKLVAVALLCSRFSMREGRHDLG
jgi:hypothetical protein